MKRVSKGFDYPVVDRTACIGCGACEKVCPVLCVPKGIDGTRAFGITVKNEEILQSSSSGGVFSLLAEAIIKDNGSVFGVETDENLRVQHTEAKSNDELQRLRGSKYVQSDIKSNYRLVRKLLDNGKKVLFSGTPCQIAGLTTYLKRDYPNLIKQDVICHGVPSPGAFEKYIVGLEKNTGKHIVAAYFRDKSISWHNSGLKIVFNDGSTVFESANSNPYLKAFIQNYSLRDCCYDCRFKGNNHVSDITLADFWGVQKVDPSIMDKRGVSLVLIHTEKGMKLFSEAIQGEQGKEVNFECAVKYNSAWAHSPKKPSKRERFFIAVEQEGFNKKTDSLMKDNIVILLKKKIKTTIKKYVRGR